MRQSSRTSNRGGDDCVFAGNRLFPLSGQNNGVDDMDDTVARTDVCLDDACVIHPNALVVSADRDVCAINGSGRVKRDDLGRINLSGHDVVREDGNELIVILGLEQMLERAGRKLGERFVIRRENRERAFALQRAYEVCGIERRGKCLDLRARPRQSPAWRARQAVFCEFRFAWIIPLVSGSGEAM